MKFYSLILLCLCWSFTACGISPEEQATLTSTAHTATAAAWTATSTSTPTRTSTPTATATSTPTPPLTSTPTNTITPTPLPSSTPKPSLTPEPGRYYAPDNSYSLLLPEGLAPMDVGIAYPILAGPKSGDYILNLVFNREKSTFDVFFYAAQFQDNLQASLQDVTQISEDYLTTTEGKDYFRWELTATHEGVRYHQVYYFFGSGEWVLVAGYTRLNNLWSEYDSLVDEGMSSLRFTP